MKNYATLTRQGVNRPTHSQRLSVRPGTKENSYNNNLYCTLLCLPRTNYSWTWQGDMDTEAYSSQSGLSSKRLEEETALPCAPTLK